MKLFYKGKDGGAESTVTGYWLVEIKSLFSVVLLRFDGASREAFHNHAFNCFSWVLRGRLVEQFVGKSWDHNRVHNASWIPFVTRRSDFHKVSSFVGTTWVLSFRGPWSRMWREFRPDEQRIVRLTKGRKEIERKTA